jgi:succinoglycan biosynthesis protein ExoH
LDTNVRERFDLLRFVMIVGVVVLHTPEYVPIAAVGNDGFSLLKSFFQNALFRTTVPVLTFISGYLVFHAGLDQAPKKLFAKKARTLLVPFLAFNLPVLAGVWLMESVGGVRLTQNLTGHDPMTWLNAAFGLTGSPVNYPLNFLRDMMALVLIAPLMGLLIRHMPFIGLAVCFWFFLNNYDGALVLRDTMPIVFYVGGLAACRRWNLRALDGHAWPCLCAFLLACAAIVAFRIGNTTALRLAAPLLVWPASALLAGSRIGAWCARMNRYSFFIFVAHAPLLMLTWQLYRRADIGLPYPVYWALAPLLVSAAMVALYQAAMKTTPRLFQALLGGRGPKGARAAAPQPAAAEMAVGLPTAACIDVSATNN